MGVHWLVYCFSFVSLFGLVFIVSAIAVACFLVVYCFGLFFHGVIYSLPWLFMVLPMVVSMVLASFFMLLSMAVACFLSPVYDFV